MSRRPGGPTARQAKSRMAPGGRLRSESPVRVPLPRVVGMAASGPAPLRWRDYPGGYLWSDHPPGLTWADLRTLEDLGAS
jgi:hypothetical protein